MSLVAVILVNQTGQGIFRAPGCVKNGSIVLQNKAIQNVPATRYFVLLIH